MNTGGFTDQGRADLSNITLTKHSKLGCQVKGITGGAIFLLNVTKGTFSIGIN